MKMSLHMTAHAFNTPKITCTTFVTFQRRFVVVTKYCYIIQIFDYLRDRIFETYFSNESKSQQQKFSSAPCRAEHSADQNQSTLNIRQPPERQ